MAVKLVPSVSVHSNIGGKKTLSAWSKGQLSVSNMNLINTQSSHLMPHCRKHLVACEIHHLNYDVAQGLS